MKTNAITPVPSKWRGLCNWTMAATILSLLTLAGAVQAQVTNIIYQDNFGRSGRLDGSTPSQADTANATWHAWPQLITDGSEISVTNLNPGQPPFNNAFLPFTPQAGHVYTLTVSTLGLGGNQNWLAAGYALGESTNVYYANASVGVAWLLQRANDTNVQVFQGPGVATNATFNFPSNGLFTTWSIVLNTTNSHWTVAFLENGTQLQQYTYASNPAIGYVGIGANSATGYYKNFSLTDYASKFQPIITQEPVASTNVNLNGTLEVPAAAAGNPAVAYQWYDINNVAVSEQTNATLVITNIQAGNSYYLQVTNLLGVANSTPVAVNVVSGAPIFVINLPSQVQMRAGQSYGYSISVSGTEPLHYQWFTNGVAASSSTDPTFVPVTGVPGTYSVYVVVTNVYNGNTPGMAVSLTSTLVIDPAPSGGTNAVNCWAAPAAMGTGDGSSPTNAANYLNPGFWSTIQSQLQVSNVNVNLLDGDYNAGTLNLTGLGNPLHWLSVQSVNIYGPVFSTAGNDILDITGSQNIKFYGLKFTGPSSSWGVNCQPDYLKSCRNLEFSYCQLVNLTNAYYGVIGLLNGVRDVMVDNCTFTNNTNGSHQHMIYASHDIVGVVVTNCLFQDCLADYVRFRDDSEYCVVENCSFVSTMSATAWPFISVELYNDVDPGPGNEFFGTYFQISSNSFAYNVSGGPGPYSALHFSDSGYSPQSYDCDLTSPQSSQLSSGTTGLKQSFLQTNLGILASGIKMFGNTYNPRVSYSVDYYYSWDDMNAPFGGWQGTIDLSDVPDASGVLLGPTPVMRNSNFDRQGLLLLPASSSNLKNWECLFRTWLCNPKYTDILWHPGFNGTSNAMRFDGTTSQYVYQWITSSGPTWTMDCVFAIGSSFTGNGTKFRVDVFHNDIAGSKVSVGVDNLGRFGIYNGGAFTVLPELGTVAFSVDNNGNGYYTDPDDILNVYRLRIVGNYAASTPYVNIYTSDANSPMLTHQSLGKAFWVNGAPASGRSAPGTIAFYNYTATVVLDQVAIGSGLAEQPPVVTSVMTGAGQFVFSGMNGFPGDTYYLLFSTNLVSPGSWTTESSNTFDANGLFSVTNVLKPGAPQKFYRLQLQ